jgi:hypothetical protein
MGTKVVVVVALPAVVTRDAIH